VGLRALRPPVQGLPEQAAEASKTRLQTAMRGLGTQGPVAPQQIAAAGAEAVQQQAKAQAQARQQEAQLSVGMQEARLGQQALGQREALQQRKVALGKSLREAENRLQALGMTTKQELFDATMRFEQDEMGRTVFNERQLLDYAATHAKDIEALQDYEQTISQMSERRLRLMQVAQAKIEQALQQAYAQEESTLNQEHKLGLTRAMAAIKEKMAKEKAAAQNRSNIWGAVTGTLAAGIVAAIPGGAAFAPAAYSIGSGVGKTVASS
jgi:hypothetical protein